MSCPLAHDASHDMNFTLPLTRSSPRQARMMIWTFAWMSLGAWACERPRSPLPAPPSSSLAPPAPLAPSGAAPDASKLDLGPPTVRWRFPAPARLVAVGDVHGDLDALRRALRGAQLIDQAHRWIGAQAVLVQTGDVLDRGDQEQEILDWLQDLKAQARAQGGDVIQLLGNHETMNVMGDLRYVTPGGLRDFEDVPDLPLQDPRLQRVPAPMRARAAALMPGGPYARKLAAFPVVAQVADTLFAHGGVSAQHVEAGLDALNQQTAAWIWGVGPMPALVADEQGPLWMREQSASDDPQMCARLQRALDAAGASRLVIGHTPQRSGVTSACEGRVWRIDVGMAAHYGGSPQSLEIVGQQVRVLSAP